MTISEAARVLGVSVDTVKRRITAGQLAAHREARPQGSRWIVELPDELVAQATHADPRDLMAEPETGLVEILRAEIRRLEELVQFMSADLDVERRQNAALLHAVQELRDLVRQALDRPSAVSPVLPAGDSPSLPAPAPAFTHQPAERRWWPKPARRISQNA
jgi:excisionase family DNA binding protein